MRSPSHLSNGICVLVTEMRIYSSDLMLRLPCPQMHGEGGSSLSSYEPASLQQAPADILAVNGGVSKHLQSLSSTTPTELGVPNHSQVKMDLTLPLKEYMIPSHGGTELTHASGRCLICACYEPGPVPIATDTMVSRRAMALPPRAPRWWRHGIRKWDVQLQPTML